jgi:hypothetical protein
MNFQSKNFAYSTKTFGDFLDQVDRGGRLYLRSLSSEKPAELPADITRDFPSLAEDFRLPPELALVTENAHSCPLRISGPVIMWLHYDVSSCSLSTFSANMIRLWRMYFAKSGVQNGLSFSHPPMSSILDSNQALRVRALMYSMTFKVRVSRIRTLTKCYSTLEIYSSYLPYGFILHHQPMG